MEIRANTIPGITALKVSVVGLAFNLLVPIVPVVGKGDCGTTPSTRLTTDVVGQLPPTRRRNGLALTRGTVVSQRTTTPRLLRARTRSWTRRRRSNSNNNSHYNRKQLTNQSAARRRTRTRNPEHETESPQQNRARRPVLLRASGQSGTLVVRFLCFGVVPPVLYDVPYERYTYVYGTARPHAFATCSLSPVHLHLWWIKCRV